MSKPHEDDFDPEETEGEAPSDDSSGGDWETVPTENGEGNRKAPSSEGDVTWIVPRDGQGNPVGPGDMPHRLGNYELEERLGSGAMGQVFRARSLRTGSTVAVKVARADGRPEFVEALREEVRRLASLNVPNVPTVIDTGEEQGFVWMAQEWIRGRDLREIIRRRRDSESSFHVDLDDEDEGKTPRERPRPGLENDAGALREFMRWFRDLARALAGVHAEGIVHRDIKPANIMLFDEKIPHLIDFGLALQDDGRLVAGDLVGTVPYMSPEQAGLGFGGIDAKSDIYSLGVTFHELVTGERVVKSEQRGAMIREIQLDTVPAPSKVNRAVPRSLDAIFRRATAKHPRDRYADAGELADALDDWLRPSNLRSRIRRTLADRRGSVMVFGAVLVLLFVSVAALIRDPFAEDRLILEEACQAASSPSGDLSGKVARAWELTAAKVGDESWREGMGDDVTSMIGATAWIRSAASIASVSLTHRSETQLLHERIADASERLLEAGIEHPDLHFHVIFADLMKSRPDERVDAIVARIEDEIASTSNEAAGRRLLQLERFAFFRHERPEEAAEVEARIAREASGLAARPDRRMEDCLESLGLLFIRKRSDEQNARLLELLDLIDPERIAGPHWRRTARALSARILLEFAEPEVALEHIDALAVEVDSDHSVDGDARRSGLRVFELRAQLELAARKPTRTDALVPAIISQARPIFRKDPALLSWFAREFVSGHFSTFRLDEKVLHESVVITAPVLSASFLTAALPLSDVAEKGFTKDLLIWLDRATHALCALGRADLVTSLDLVLPREPVYRSPDAKCAELWTNVQTNLLGSWIVLAGTVESAEQLDQLLAQVRSFLTRRGSALADSPEQLFLEELVCGFGLYRLDATGSDAEKACERMAAARAAIESEHADHEKADLMIRRFDHLIAELRSER